MNKSDIFFGNNCSSRVNKLMRPTLFESHIHVILHAVCNDPFLSCLAFCRFENFFWSSHEYSNPCHVCFMWLRKWKGLPWPCPQRTTIRNRSWINCDMLESRNEGEEMNL